MTALTPPCQAPLVGDKNNNLRNHGLTHDRTGWRLFKVFDFTPLPTFVSVLAMGVGFNGSQECSALNL